MPDAAATVTLTIDGREVAAAEGTSILQAARAEGIEIPTLCAREGLPVYGSCRLCLVEIRRGTWSKLVVSCAYPVEAGLEVCTENDRIAKHRKVVLELLATRWDHLPDDLMARYGADPDRFEKNSCFCILCGLCVRHCAEVKGEHVLGFVGRGTERQVVIYPDRAEKACPRCGDGHTMECLEVCPTGVISSEFSVAGLTPPGRRPLAYPICIREDDNLQQIADLVGDRGGE